MMSQTQTIHSLPMKGVNTAASFDTTNHQESLSVPESRLPFKFSFLSFFPSLSRKEFSLNRRDDGGQHKEKRPKQNSSGHHLGKDEIHGGCCCSSLVNEVLLFLLISGEGSLSSVEWLPKKEKKV
jgi:hypothetical protein